MSKRPIISEDSFNAINSTISQKLSDLKVKTPFVRISKRRFILEHLEEILELRKNGFKYDVIALQINEALRDKCDIVFTEYDIPTCISYIQQKKKKSCISKDDS